MRVFKEIPLVHINHEDTELRHGMNVCWIGRIISCEDDLISDLQWDALGVLQESFRQGTVLRRGHSPTCGFPHAASKACMPVLDARYSKRRSQ